MTAKTSFGGAKVLGEPEKEHQESSSSDELDSEKGWSDADDDELLEDTEHKTHRTFGKDSDHSNSMDSVDMVRVRPRPSSAPRSRQGIGRALPPLKNIHEEPAWRKSQYYEG